MIRLTRHIITAAFVFAAIAAPASAAQNPPSPDDRDAANLSTPTVSLDHLGSPDARESANVSTPTVSLDHLGSPDARESANVSTPTVSLDHLGSPDARAGSSVSSNDPVRASAPVIDEPSGFDWGDAGIGAAGMLALFALAGGTVLVVSHYRKGRGRMPVATR